MVAALTNLVIMTLISISTSSSGRGDYASPNTASRSLRQNIPRLAPPFKRKYAFPKIFCVEPGKLGRIETFANRTKSE